MTDLGGERWTQFVVLVAAGSLLAACSSAPRVVQRPAQPTSVPTVSADSTAGVFLIGKTGRGVVHGTCDSPGWSSEGMEFWVSVATVQQGVGVDVRVPLSASPTTSVIDEGEPIGVRAAAQLLSGRSVTAYVVRQRSGKLLVERLEIGREATGISISF